MQTTKTQQTLKETIIKELGKYGKSESDVLFVGSMFRLGKNTLDSYNHTCDAVSCDFKVIGEGWWLEVSNQIPNSDFRFKTPTKRELMDFMRGCFEEFLTSKINFDCSQFVR